MTKQPNDVLVSLMNNTADFKIVLNNGWYRIAVENVPPIIKDNTARIIASYYTKNLTKEQFQFFKVLA